MGLEIIIVREISQMQRHFQHVFFYLWVHKFLAATYNTHTKNEKERLEKGDIKMKKVYTEVLVGTHERNICYLLPRYPHPSGPQPSVRL